MLSAGLGASQRSENRSGSGNVGALVHLALAFDLNDTWGVRSMLENVRTMPSAQNDSTTVGAELVYSVDTFVVVPSLGGGIALHLAPNVESPRPAAHASAAIDFALLSHWWIGLCGRLLWITSRDFSTLSETQARAALRLSYRF